MVSMHRMHKWLISLCTIGTLCLLLGCEADGREECSGVGGFISCLSIDSIQPTDMSSTNSSNVDASANTCADGAGEPFGDHGANITFSNRQFPANIGNDQLEIDGSLLVTIVNYSVSYTMNDCPDRATGCPALTGFSVSPGQTLTIPAGGSVTTSFPFVPLRVKEEYVAEGGHLGSTQFGFPFPSYTANYLFTARSDFFSGDIEVEGSAQFTIGSFNLCGG